MKRSLQLCGAETAGRGGIFGPHAEKIAGGLRVLAAPALFYVKLWFSGAWNFWLSNDSPTATLARCFSSAKGWRIAPKGGHQSRVRHLFDGSLRLP